MHMRQSIVLMALLSACANGPPPPAAYQPGGDPELLHAAVQQLTDVIVYDILSPPQASRAYAYASIAAYEAVRPAHPGQRTLAGQVRGLAPLPEPAAGADYNYPLAATHAFLIVGRALTFSHDRLDSTRVKLEQPLRSRMSPAVFERSIAYGDTVAQRILAWAAKDNYLQTRGYPKYTVTADPGRWRPTPPAYMDAVEPYWNKIRPFVLDSAAQFRPQATYRFDMQPGSQFYKEAREVYDVGRTLSDERRAIAAFWDCNPYVMHVQGHTMFATKKITPGGHWMGIVAIAARLAHADFMRSAEAYARTAIALNEAFIAVWDEKYRSNVIRPETVINAYIDERWEPLLQTPPFPEYTSGHSGISTAASIVLTDEFGDTFGFTDDVEKAYGLPARSFTSFKQAAAEAAISRLYGGIHYRHAIEQGQVQGRSVGDLVVQRIQTKNAVATTASF